MQSYGFDLSGIGLRVSGERGDLLQRLAEDWGPYQADDLTDALLDCRVSTGAGTVPADSSFDPKGMTASYDADGAYFTMPEGTVEIARGTGARIVLNATDDRERSYFALRNLIRAGLAWRLPDRDALLVHSAGIVLGGRAFVLVGPSGSGKSTWSRIAREAGAGLLSEDVVVIQRTGDELFALGAPFRVPRGIRPLHGSFPLAAILTSRHGEAVGLDPLPKDLLRTALVANLPFLAEALEVDPRPLATVERMLEVCSAYRLTFRVDDSFIPLLDGIG